ncbi:MAG: zinc-binding dehydrogenase [Clostridiales bacterium]|nr:zinc-binding dehydrogenase [Clostridiales bacterium]
MLPEKMKAVVVTAPEKAEVMEVSMPVPVAGEVLVKIEKALICTWEQRIFGGGDVKLPFVPGHEISGVVAAVPEGTFTRLKVGDKVVVKTLDACGQCENCRRGNDNLCKEPAKKRFYDGIPGSGGFAQYMAIAADRVFEMPNQDMDLEIAAFAEPLACVLRSFENANVTMSEDVVIVGGGIMGQLHNLVAKRKGCRTIFVEPDEARRNMAKELGADVVINPMEVDAVEKIKELTNGYGAHVVFYTIGVLKLAQDYIEALRKGGSIVYYGSYHPSGKIEIDPNQIHYSEKIITGSISPTSYGFWMASRLLSYGIIDVAPLLSAKYKMEDCEEAFRMARRPDTYRVLIDLA